MLEAARTGVGTVGVGYGEREGSFERRGTELGLREEF